jgi:DNA-binding CsgD family transcriptional regulator/PAS domain-containing protein
VFDDDAFRLIDDIYSTVTEPERWPDVLARISRSHSGSHVVMGRQDWDGNAGDVMNHGLPGPVVERFLTAYAALATVPYRHALLQANIGETLVPEEAFGEAAWLADPGYRAVLAAFGLRYLVSALLQKEVQFGRVMALVRDERAGAFRADERARLSWTAQHVGRALLLAHSLAEARGTQAILADVLDRSSRAIVVADAHATLVHANGAAKELLGRGDGLRLVSGRLTALRAGDAARLHQLVVEAAATSAGSGVSPGGALRIPRPDGAADYMATVSPLSTALMRGTERRALVLVVITDPVGPSPASASSWREAFGLTDAEARVALGLLEGLAPAAIAARHGVSLPTVRSQIRSLFAKTGTRRQAELLVVLGRITPG